MELFRRLEALGEKIFLRRAPFQLREETRKRVADVLWLMALAIGLAHLLSAVLLWRAGQRAAELAEATNYLSRLYGNDAVGQPLGFFFYISVTLILFNAVVIMVAIPGLRAHRKAKGWNYLLCALLLALLAALLRTFSAVNGGFGSLLPAVLGVAIGGYILFQVRPYFNGMHQEGEALPAEKSRQRPSGPIRQD